MGLLQTIQGRLLQYDSPARQLQQTSSRQPVSWLRLNSNLLMLS